MYNLCWTGQGLTLEAITNAACSTSRLYALDMQGLGCVPWPWMGDKLL